MPVPVFLQMAKLVWVPNGPKLGLGIKHFQNRVLVSRCDPGSLSSTQLAVGSSHFEIHDVAHCKQQRRSSNQFL